MIDNRIFDLARKQRGLINRRQLRHLGISAKAAQRARSSGWFRPVFSDVFLIAPAPDDFQMRCRAIQLWVHNSGFVSGRSAGRLRGLGRMPTWPIEYTVPTAVTRETPHWVTLHRSSWYIEDRDREKLACGLMVARPIRMLFGIAAATSGQSIFDRAADDAWNTKLITPGDVEQYLARHRCRGKDGVAKIEQWLERVSAQERPSQSYFERDLADALVQAGVPAPIEQYPLTLLDGSLIHLDLAWPDIRLAVEPGHSRFHQGETALERDTLRDLACGELGWDVHRLTERALQNLPAVARRLARIHDIRTCDVAPPTTTPLTSSIPIGFTQPEI